MALVYVGPIGTIDTFTTGSITVGPGGVQQGNTILIGLVSNFTGKTPTIVDDQGNTYVIDENDQNLANVVRAYVATSLPGAASITFDYDPEFVRFRAEAHEFTGIAQASPLDKHTQGDVSFDTTHTSGLTAATTEANEVLFGCSQVSSGNAWTPSGSWIEVEDAEYGVTSGRLVIQYQIVSATGAYQSNGTTGANCDSFNTIATYKAETAVATGPSRAQVTTSSGTSW